MTPYQNGYLKGKYCDLNTVQSPPEEYTEDEKLEWWIGFDEAVDDRLS